jgi:hypothetical protein
MHLNRECRYPDLSNLFVRELQEQLPHLAEELGRARRGSRTCAEEVA